ncbi:hypothetical protein Tco_1454722, partial [Tanacetum coccineum]
IMSLSTVTYTSISFDSDLPPWGFHLISDTEPQSPEPLPADASTIALSPGYVVEFDPLDEDPKEDPEEDPANYPADDEEEEDSSEDDDDEKEKEASEEDEDEEEEHLAPADSTTLPAIDPVPSAKKIEQFEIDNSAATPPPPPCTYASSPIPPSPPPSPLSPLSSLLPRIPSPPLILPPLHTSPTYARAPLGYRAAMVQLRAASPSTTTTIIITITIIIATYIIFISSPSDTISITIYTITTLVVTIC